MQNLRQTLSSNKTPLLIIFLVIATVLLVALAMAPTGSPLPTPKLGEQKEEMADTTLSFSEPYQIDENVEASGAAKITQSDILIDSGNNKVTGVQLEIKYNPALLGSVDITAGDFLQNPAVLIKKIDTQEGIISFALGTEGEGLKGAGTIASITFVPRAGVRGEAAFEFLSKTSVSAEDIDKTVLKEMNGLEFTLGGNEEPTSSSAEPTSL